MQCAKHGQHEIFNQTSNILSHKYKPLEQPIYLRAKSDTAHHRSLVDLHGNLMLKVMS